MIEHGVAVRELAEFCHRSGDIDFRFTPSPTGSEGVAGHQQVTRGRGAGYQAEYPLEGVFECGGCRLQLRGRADGYDASAGVLE